MSLDPNDTSEINASQLGTKGYWEKTYDRDLKNFHEIGDRGDIWFGEDSMKRVLSAVKNLCPDLHEPVIDVGCGNGETLLNLAKHGFTNLTGVDYAESAVELARQIAATENLQSQINYEHCDVLKEPCESSILFNHFRIVIDVGTFDAISLSENNKSKREQYISVLERLLADSGYLVITSCNWTKEELVEQFHPHLKLLKEIPTPKFQFGGKSGNTVVTLVLHKNQ